jgi:hypothetical protein
MKKEQFDDLKKHQKTLEQDREKYDEAMKDIAMYIMPFRYNWDEDEEDDADRPVIYDSTGVEANRVLADGYQGYLINPRSPWVSIRFEDKQVDGSAKADQWKKIAEECLYRIFARSNFYSAVGMCLMDGAFGTATMYIEPYKNTVVNFIPQHPKGIYVEQNRHGVIDTVFQRMRLSARDILNSYEKAIPENMKKEMKDDPFKKYTVWRAVMPNNERILNNIGPKGMPFKSITYMHEIDHPLKEGGYRRLPYAIWRPMVLTGQAYGKSSAWYALGSVKRLNIIQKDLLELATLSVKPPLNVPGEDMDEVNMTPWGMNPYSDPTRQIFPVSLGGNFPYGQEELTMLQNEVRSYFQTEAFMLLSQMADKEYTATQAAEMAGEKSAQLSSLTSRVTRFLDDIIEQVILIAIDAGEIPMPPQELIRGGLKLDYVGPITIDQERAFRTTGLMRGLNQIVPFLEINPSIWMLIKDTEVFREILEGSAFPKSMMRSKQELEQIQANQAQQQQAQQQAELQKTQGQAYKEYSYQPQEGSPSKERMQRG